MGAWINLLLAKVEAGENTGPDFIKGLMNVLSLIMSFAGIGLVVYIVYLAFLFFTAHDPNRRKKAKDRSFKAASSLLIVFILIVVLNGLNITISTRESASHTTDLAGLEANYLYGSDIDSAFVIPKINAYNVSGLSGSLQPDELTYKNVGFNADGKDKYYWTNKTYTTTDDEGHEIADTKVYWAYYLDFTLTPDHIKIADDKKDKAKVTKILDFTPVAQNWDKGKYLEITPTNGDSLKIVYRIHFGRNAETTTDVDCTYPNIGLKDGGKEKIDGKKVKIARLIVKVKMEVEITKTDEKTKKTSTVKEIQDYNYDFKFQTTEYVVY